MNRLCNQPSRPHKLFSERDAVEIILSSESGLGATFEFGFAAADGLVWGPAGEWNVYATLKTLHLIGAVLLIGNVTVSAVWKVFADRTGDVRVMRFSQRLVTITDWSLTLSGILLLIAGGYGMLYIGRLSPIGLTWLVYGQLLFGVSGAIWLAVLVPAQIRLAREARKLSEATGVTEAYRVDNRLWLIWGVIATVPLVAAIYVMTAKP